MPKYPNLVVPLAGMDGNAFSILGRVNKAMLRAKVPKEERDAYYAEATSGNYDNLIRVTMKWVNCDGLDNPDD